MRVLLVFVLLVCAFAAKAQFEEGKHFTVVSEDKTEEPTVTEFFSLFCSHCFQFEPMLGQFQQALPNGTKFEKSHVSYMPRNNEPVQEGIVKAFITMQKLGKEKQLSKIFFNHIHQERKPLETIESIKTLFVNNGVSSADFDKVYGSESVADETKAMMDVWQEKKVNSVPTVLVNGKYLVNMGSLSNMSDLNGLVNYLLEKE